MASPVKDAKLEAQQIWPGATAHARGKGFITHQHPTNPRRKLFITELGALGFHFGDGPFTEANEVDTAWVDADPILDAPWQKKMVLADYNVYFGPGYTEFVSDPLIKCVHPASGESVTFQPMGLYYTNDLDDEQQISEPAEVAVSIVDDTLTWIDAYGTGIDLQWQNQVDVFAKFVGINSLAELGSPLPYIIAGGNPALRLQFIYERSPGIRLWVDGVEFDEKKDTVLTTSNDIEFRDTETGDVLWRFRSPNVWDSEMNTADASLRIRGTTQDTFIEVRVPYSWISAAIFPIVIDPTLDFQPDESASKDTYLSEPAPTTNYGTDVALICRGSPSTSSRSSLIEFDISEIPSDATCDVATLYIYNHSSGTATQTTSIHELLVANEDWTEAGATWETKDGSNAWAGEDGCWDSGVDYNATALGSFATVSTDADGVEYDASLTLAAIEDWFDTPNLNYGIILLSDNRYITQRYHSSSASTAGYRPKLHIEYTTGGIVISMGYATLASSAQGLNVIPGAKSVPMSEATLVSAPQALTVDAPPPPVTISMSAATLVSDPQALSVLPGGITIPMSEATLVGAPQALTALVSGGPLTISMAVATLVAAAQALDVKPGTVSIPMSETTLVSAAQALDVIPGAATVPMSTATLVSAAQALDLILGAISVPMSAVTLASAAQALNVDAATGVTISMSVATLVAAAQGLSIVPGGVSIPLGDVELAGSAQALTVVTPISGTIIPMSAITLVSAAQGLTVIPPAPTIAMSPTTLVGSAQALTAKPGGVTIPLSAITLVSNAQNARLVAIARVGLQAVTLQAQAQNLNVVAGQVIIPMQTVTLTAVLLTLNRVGIPYAAFFRIYALLGEHIPETAYNLQGEHIVEGALEGEHIPETEVDIDGEV